MKDLLSYYQEEILWLRKEGGRFALNYPEIASKLDLHSGVSTDPQTERLIESFAFLSARIQSKIAEHSSILPQYILSALYPGITNVFPPCSIVEFSQSENTNNIARIEIEKNTKLYYSSKSGHDYIFKTVYPITIYPLIINAIKVVQSQLRQSPLAQSFNKNSNYQLMISIKSLSVPIDKMKIDNLLFSINSDYIDKSLKLYAALFPINSNELNNIYIKIDNRILQLPRNNIHLYGYNDTETVVPIAKFMNYSFQMLREVLIFPQKFLFFSITDLDSFFKINEVKDIDEILILINIDQTFIDDIDQFQQEIDKNSISINSVPIVNLFEYTSDSFRFDNTKNKYIIKADSSKESNIEIHSIESVHMINEHGDRKIPQYFGMLDHKDNDFEDLYWLQVYEPNMKQNGIYISFVDTNMNPNKVYSDIAYAKTICINKSQKRDITIGTRLYSEKPVIATVKMLFTKSEYINQNNNLWNLITQLSFSKINNSDAFLENIKNLAEFYSGDYFSHMLEGIKSLDVKQKYIRKSNAFVPQLVFNFKLTKRLKYHYTYIFLKVLYKYTKNIQNINNDILFHLFQE